MLVGGEHKGTARKVKLNENNELHVNESKVVETLLHTEVTTDGVWKDLTGGFVEVGSMYQEFLLTWSADTVTNRTFEFEITWSSTPNFVTRASFTEPIIQFTNTTHFYKNIEIKREYVRIRYRPVGNDHDRAVIQVIWKSLANGTSTNVKSIESHLNKKTTIPGRYLDPQTEYVFATDFEFSGRTTAWALYMYEMLRPTNNLENGNVEVVIEFSDTKGNYSSEVGGRLIFSQAVTLSQSDEVGKGLLVLPSTTSTQGSNIILAGEYFNVPIAKYMRITIKNNLPLQAIRFLPLSIVEEGNFDV